MNALTEIYRLRNPVLPADVTTADVLPNSKREYDSVVSLRPAKHIDYADPDLDRRLWVRRLIRFGLAILVLGVAAYCGRTLIHSAATFYYRWQCDVYIAAPEFVVYAEDPAEVAKLRSDPRYTIEGREVDPPSALFHAPCSTAFDKLIRPNAQLTSPSATVFLHELRTAKGTRRLVRITYQHSLQHSAGHDYFFIDGALLDTTSGTASSIWHRVHPLMENRRALFSEQTWRARGFFRMYAGQLDPADPARFSIRCRRGAEDGFIDGWLEDGRNGPTLRVDARFTILEKR